MARTAGNGLVLTGDKQLDRLMKRLPLSIQRKHMRAALRKGAHIIAGEARANAPVLTGALQGSIKVRAGKARRRGDLRINVLTGEGFFKGDQFYGAFLEYGTSRMAPQPFMRPAFDTKHDEAQQAIAQHLRTAITSEARGTT